VATQGELSKLTLPKGLDVEKWPVAQLNSEWTGKNMLLIINPELSEPIALDASRIAKKDADGLTIVSSIPLSDTLGGSAVTDAETGLLVGLLTKINGVWIVAR